MSLFLQRNKNAFLKKMGNNTSTSLYTNCLLAPEFTFSMLAAIPVAGRLGLIKNSTKIFTRLLPQTLTSVKRLQRLVQKFRIYVRSFSGNIFQIFFQKSCASVFQ